MVNVDLFASLFGAPISGDFPKAAPKGNPGFEMASFSFQDALNQFGEQAPRDKMVAARLVAELESGGASLPEGVKIQDVVEKLLQNSTAELKGKDLRHLLQPVPGAIVPAASLPPNGSPVTEVNLDEHGLNSAKPKGPFPPNKAQDTSASSGLNSEQKSQTDGHSQLNPFRGVPELGNASELKRVTVPMRPVDWKAGTPTRPQGIALPMVPAPSAMVDAPEMKAVPETKAVPEMKAVPVAKAPASARAVVAPAALTQPANVPEIRNLAAPQSKGETRVPAEPKTGPELPVGVRRQPLPSPEPKQKALPKERLAPLPVVPAPSAKVNVPEMKAVSETKAVPVAKATASARAVVAPAASTQPANVPEIRNLSELQSKGETRAPAEPKPGPKLPVGVRKQSGQQAVAVEKATAREPSSVKTSQFQPQPLPSPDPKQTPLPKERAAPLPVVPAPSAKVNVPEMKAASEMKAVPVAKAVPEIKAVPESKASASARAVVAPAALTQPANVPEIRNLAPPPSKGETRVPAEPKPGPELPDGVRKQSGQQAVAVEKATAREPSPVKTSQFQPQPVPSTDPKQTPLPKERAAPLPVVPAPSAKVNVPEMKAASEMKAVPVAKATASARAVVAPAASTQPANVPEIRNLAPPQSKGETRAPAEPKTGPELPVGVRKQSGQQAVAVEKATAREPSPLKTSQFQPQPLPSTDPKQTPLPKERAAPLPTVPAPSAKVNAPEMKAVPVAKAVPETKVASEMKAVPESKAPASARAVVAPAASTQPANVPGIRNLAELQSKGETRVPAEPKTGPELPVSVRKQSGQQAVAVEKATAREPSPVKTSQFQPQPLPSPDSKQTPLPKERPAPLPTVPAPSAKVNVPESKAVPETKAVPVAKAVPEIKAAPVAKAVPEIKAVPESKAPASARAVVAPAASTQPANVPGIRNLAELQSKGETRVPAEPKTGPELPVSVRKQSGQQAVAVEKATAREPSPVKTSQFQPQPLPSTDLKAAPLPKDPRAHHPMERESVARLSAPELKSAQATKAVSSPMSLSGAPESPDVKRALPIQDVADPKLSPKERALPESKNSPPGKPLSNFNSTERVTPEIQKPQSFQSLSPDSLKNLEGKLPSKAESSMGRFEQSQPELNSKLATHSKSNPDELTRRDSSDKTTGDQAKSATVTTPFRPVTELPPQIKENLVNPHRSTSALAHPDSAKASGEESGEKGQEREGSSDKREGRRERPSVEAAVGQSSKPIGDRPVASRLLSHPVFSRILDHIEKYQNANQTRQVQLKIDLAQSDQVRVQLKVVRGQLQTLFHVDTDGIRHALREGWEQFQRQLLEKGIHADLPQFTEDGQGKGGSFNRENWEFEREMRGLGSLTASSSAAEANPEESVVPEDSSVENAGNFQRWA